MAHDIRIAISCPDRTGLLAAVTARLFDLGSNLGDTSFTVLGAEATYTCVAEMCGWNPSASPAAQPAVT